MVSKKQLSEKETTELLDILQQRFEKNTNRHPQIDWSTIESKLKENPIKLWSLNEMEISGGEPDVVDYDKKSDEYVFFDCSPESPKGRRSFCYDRKALDSRKENKPQNDVLTVAKEMGVDILDETQYRFLQTLGEFDLKTSSWIKTPKEIRALGGALFCDRRYDTVFVYHNGANSYYAARAFRGVLKV
ncbi:hypothetical protein CHRY9390_00580 [Chryseobacterium aquaeductus]|uniref:DUF4256 domain-containing protein n=1 Tax=Chryseobacterium aquaeductus TaxID=2675056 RepID=A0A9N8MFW9_9FLAO|nr:DUF4256 domain-containing protein [Chryseobacterium aquaeductus]CAA7329931.1 hypothetical protein CHRY9390_00580 [Chryseobacterium potabilaquae]CAD7800088.1 hypothetical protein CHRY9390_00580 [Chryseobacterium aquaeductus]